MSLPARTVYVADHGSVTCAVVVESGESAGLRAAALPVLSALVGLILGVYRMGWTPEVASGAGLLVGSLLTVALAPIFVFAVVFTLDQTPRDRDERVNWWL